MNIVSDHYKSGQTNRQRLIFDIHAFHLDVKSGDESPIILVKMLSAVNTFLYFVSATVSLSAKC